VAKLLQAKYPSPNQQQQSTEGWLCSWRRKACWHHAAKMGHGCIITYAVITTAIRLQYDYDMTMIRLQSNYDVSRMPASTSTQAKNEHVNFSS